MKRDIACTECVIWWNEHRHKQTRPRKIKIVGGIAIKHFNCDTCNADIYPGMKCAAVSVWTDDLEAQGKGSYCWESDFIDAIDLQDE